MADDDRQQKPSMDEILSSIRRVASSDEEGAKTEGEVERAPGEPDGDAGGSEEKEEHSMDEILSSIRRVVLSEEEGVRTKTGVEAAPDAGVSEERQEPSTDEILSSISSVASSEEESKKTDAVVANVQAETDADTFVSEKPEVPSMDEILSSIRRVVSPEEDDKTKNEMDIAPGQLDANGNSLIDGDDSSGSDSVSTPSLQKQEGNPDISEMKVRELGAQLMRPVMLEWLNQNLPPMVEQLVRSEVERLKKETE